VQLHHGEVEARSDGPGHGSEFVVRLPAVLADEAMDAVSQEPAAATSNAATGAAGTIRGTSTPQPQQDDEPCHVLVVDDNRDAADSMAVFLELAGFDTQVELDGARALDLAAASAPDVVLLDIGLPGLDGYEVARRLRTLPDGDRCLLIALTGYGQQDDRRRAHEAGFDVHLVKPADPDAVVELIQEWRLRASAALHSEATTR